MRLIAIALVPLFSVSVALAAPDVVKEPACTRKKESALDGRQFVLPEEGRINKYQFRYNKAEWAKYNKYPEPKEIAGRRATVLCSEDVPGPSTLQHVIAVQVEGFEKPLFMRDTDVYPFLKVAKETDEIESAKSVLAAYVGNYVWAKPRVWTYQKVRPYPQDLVLPNNLERVRVLSADIYKDIVSGPQIHVSFERPDGSRVMQVYGNLMPKATFERGWHTVDPRVQFPNWPESLWQKIAAGKVEIGMNTDMVEMAIGSPNDINTTQGESYYKSQWVYGSLQSGFSYYYFNNGVLETIQK